MARPRKHIQHQREQEFARALVQTGGRWQEAQRIAGIHGDHIVRLMDRADFRCLAAAMLIGDAPPMVAVEVTVLDQVAA